MLESFKRMFARPGHDRDFTPIAEWAERRSCGFKRVRHEDGFVIDGLLEQRPWRLEWGPPQRDYIDGHELRLRMELDLPSDMQMLLLSRPLMDALERLTFEEFTDDVQTQIGTKTPEEMRWLVMFPKVSLTSLKALRARFGAVASTPALGLSWIEGALANQLEAAGSALLRDDPPFVLMTLRGRVYLRMQLKAPEPQAVGAALALFETAVAQALRAAAAGATVTAAGAATDSDAAAADSGADWPAAGPSTAWQSYQPDEAPASPKRR